MDVQQVRGIADRFIAQLHRLEDGDMAGVDGLAELFADDAQLTNSMIEHDEERSQRNGRDDIAQFWRQYGESFREIHSEFIDVTASDHSAGLFWRSTGTDAAGRALDYEGVSLLTLDDAGKIAQFKGYFDSRQLAPHGDGGAPQ